MSGVPYTFATATTSIPLSQLDANFATNATLGNATVGLGNTTTIVGNLTLQNPTISGGTAFTLGNTSVSFGGTTTSVGNLTLTNTTISSTNGDANIHGLTVGLGNSSISTNTALGISALSVNTTGAYNTAIGASALAANTTNNYNTAVGRNALTLSTADNNTAIGTNSMATNTSGTGNVALGNALGSNTSGNYNTALGFQALPQNTTANHNTAVGYQSGYGITTGNNNTCIGDESGYGANTLTTGISNVLIGYGASTTGGTDNYSIVIGGLGSIVGKGSGTGFIAPGSTATIGGGAVYQGNNGLSWAVTSDQRLKKNIVDNTVGLTAINGIKIRNFEYRLPDEITDLDKSNAVNITGTQLGVIAQELQTILPDCVKTESTGVMSVDSSDVLWHLVTAVQQLSAQLTTAQATITALQAKVGV